MHYILIINKLTTLLFLMYLCLVCTGMHYFQTFFKNIFLIIRSWLVCFPLFQSIQVRPAKSLFFKHQNMRYNNNIPVPIVLCSWLEVSTIVILKRIPIIIADPDLKLFSVNCDPWLNILQIRSSPRFYNLPEYQGTYPYCLVSISVVDPVPYWIRIQELPANKG